MAKNKKQKGLKWERELVDILEENGYGATRIPASGAASRNLPDIICGNTINYYAIEVKSINTSSIYIKEEQIMELGAFACKFGAKPLVAVKFNREPFTVFNPDRLHRTKKGYYRIRKKDLCDGVEITEFLKQTYME